jgi:porphobilinogen synthase
MAFPLQRMRRLRKNPTLRRMVRENEVKIDDLIYPLFVVHGQGVKSEIKALPGNYYFSIDRLVEEAREVKDLGIPAILLFGVTEKRDSCATEAYSDQGIVQQAVRKLKESVPELVVITDVCSCEYTDHENCGIMEEGYLVNDASVDLLVKTTLSHARAGADMVAPAAMLDGQVRAMRMALESEGFPDVAIMSYSAKFASKLYDPFFKSTNSTTIVDKRTHQMDYSNADEALREIALDIEEGVDICIVKPALFYLDIVSRVKQKFGFPVAVYNVSGEYAIFKAAAEAGCIDEKNVRMEMLTAFKRAGADLIITYFAKQVAAELRSS